MGRSIFVSYKYSDGLVLPISADQTTARSYVDELEHRLTAEDHIFKGENDGEDLGNLADSTIGSKLGDKIFLSSITLVLVSKGMKENIPERDQWIPWEISYSLREQSRDGKRSKSNAVLVVVLPDEANSYGYFLQENPDCRSITYHTDRLFQILRDNMFNAKDKEANIRNCNGSKIYEGYHSYICSVKWTDFINNISYYLNTAENLRQDIDRFNIVKNIQ